MKDSLEKLMFYLSPEGLSLARKYGLVLPISPNPDDEVDIFAGWDGPGPPPVLQRDSAVSFGGIDKGKVVFIVDPMWPEDKIRSHVSYWVDRLRALAGIKA